MSEFLNTERVGDSFVIRFVRPEIRNPLSRNVVESLLSILGEISGSDIGRVIFTGTGDAFASGANLKEIGPLSAVEAPEFARLGQTLMGKIAALPQETIAAINGHCFGGALDLALACDKRIASPAATFAHPGTGLGIITGWGGTQRLPRLIGQANALEMFFTARAIDARRALAIGLVDSVADDIFDNDVLRLTGRRVEAL